MAFVGGTDGCLVVGISTTCRNSILKITASRARAEIATIASLGPRVLTLSGGGRKVTVFWPRGVSREISLPAFLDVFLTLGYEECQDADLEAGYEKVALFAKLNTSGNLEPTHAAKQLPDGRWTSKLGPLEDIEHDEVEDVSGPSYGEPVQFMRRSIRVERNGGMAVRRQRE